jgi:hypothetical protein
MTAYKTVLAPNAPWPTYRQEGGEEKPLKQALKGVKRVRSKPSETDAKFEQWLKGLKNE